MTSFRPTKIEQFVIEAIAKLVRCESLSETEAAAAFETIMRGDATPVQIAGFMVALRMKGETIEEILAEARKWQVSLATAEIERQLCNAVEGHLTVLLSDPLSEQVVMALHLLEIGDRLGVALNLWWAQTLFARVCHRHLRALLSRRRHEERAAQQVTCLRRLGERLGFCALEGIALDTWESF